MTTAMAPFFWVERVSPTVRAVNSLEGEIKHSLNSLALPADKLRGRRIAVTVGSRGIANVHEIAKTICGWLKNQGARPFVFPAMGSHGGATAEGQARILSEYGVTPAEVGVEVRSSMEAVALGETPEGTRVFMDRNAWEADGILVMNRVKPHTDFSGKIESGLHKMMAVGMGKALGAAECHQWSWKFGFERTIRAMAQKVLATGKVLGALAVVENEVHQVASVRAARPEDIAPVEEECLELARRLVPRLPFPKLDLLIVDEIGKNISGTGMDTKVIGRGVRLPPGEAPEIRVIYVRDLTTETAGNATGVGFADLIHERLFRKIDFEVTNMNVRTSLNMHAARVPLYMASDREALRLAWGHLGSPRPDEQRTVWIRNTQQLNRMAVSKRLAELARGLTGWQVGGEGFSPKFDAQGNLIAGPR